MGFRDFFFSSAVLTPRVPTLPKMGSVGDWEVTAESQVSCYSFFLSCHCCSCALAHPVFLLSLHDLYSAKGHEAQGVSLCPSPPVCCTPNIPKHMYVPNGHPAPYDASFTHGIPLFPSSFLGPARVPRLLSKVSDVWGPCLVHLVGSPGPWQTC